MELNIATLLGAASVLILFGIAIGISIHKYRMQYTVKFGIKIPGEEDWHLVRVVRSRNAHEIYVNNELIISEKNGDRIWRNTTWKLMS